MICRRRASIWLGAWRCSPATAGRPSGPLSRSRRLPCWIARPPGGAGGRQRATQAVEDAARCLQEAHYLTDIVNEETLRAGAAAYRLIVLPAGDTVAPETRQLLGRFVNAGGVLLVCADGLLGEAPPPAPSPDETFLGLRRTARQANKPALLKLGEDRVVLPGTWDVETTTAKTLLSFGDGAAGADGQHRGTRTRRLPRHGPRALPAGRGAGGPRSGRWTSGRPTSSRAAGRPPCSPTFAPGPAKSLCISSIAAAASAGTTPISTATSSPTTTPTSATSRCSSPAAGPCAW